MSYIRSGSNPEALYIYNDGDKINIHWDDGKPNHVQCKIEDFEGLLDMYIASPYDTCFEKGELSINCEKKCVLQVRDTKIEMFDVTWEYIIQGFKGRLR